MKNENGKNEIKISIPCCDESEIEFVYRAKDNMFPYQVYQQIMQKVGLTASLKQEKEGEISVMKGTG